MFIKVPKFRELKKYVVVGNPLLLTYTFLVPKLQVFFLKKTYLSRNKSGSTVAAKSKTEDK